MLQLLEQFWSSSAGAGLEQFWSGGAERLEQYSRSFGASVQRAASTLERYWSIAVLEQY